MRILAIRSGALGDTILTLPAIAALRQLGSAVTLVGTSPYVELAKAPGLAHEVHSIDRAVFRAFFSAAVDDTELVGFLRRFGLVVAWSKLPLVGAKLERLGIDRIQATPWPPDCVHASDHLVHTLEPLGIRGPAREPKIVPEPPGPELLQRVGLDTKDYFALHPSSGSPRKNWPKSRFAELARSARSAGLAPVWIQGEADRDVVRDLVQRVPAPVARELSLSALASLLSGARGFIGNDSGVSHLAAACGVPTIAVFRSTDPRKWAPRGPRVAVKDAGDSADSVWGFACDLMDNC